MHRYAFVMLLAGLIGCSSCAKDKTAALSTATPVASTPPPDTADKAGDSCDFPPLRRPIPRFLPGPDCPNAAVAKERMVLPLEVRMQQCRLWCWSASLSALAAYNGQAFPACEIAGMGTGASCCVIDPCAQPGCDQRLPSTKVTGLLDRLGIRAEHLERALTEPELKAEIASGRPVLMVTVNPKGDQHMAVAYGYEHGLYLALDPSPSACGGGGYRYAALVCSADGEWRWSESWRLRSKQNGACLAP